MSFLLVIRYSKVAVTSTITCTCNINIVPISLLFLVQTERLLDTGYKYCNVTYRVHHHVGSYDSTRSRIHLLCFTICYEFLDIILITKAWISYILY